MIGVIMLVCIKHYVLNIQEIISLSDLKIQLKSSHPRCLVTLKSQECLSSFYPKIKWDWQKNLGECFPA
jgi:hypothetical protein